MLLYRNIKLLYRKYKIELSGTKMLLVRFDRPNSSQNVSFIYFNPFVFYNIFWFTIPFIIKNR